MRTIPRGHQASEFLANIKGVVPIEMELCDGPPDEMVANPNAEKPDSTSQFEIVRVPRFEFDVWDGPADRRLRDAALGFLYLLRNWVTTEGDAISRERVIVLREVLFGAAATLPGANARASLLRFRESLADAEDDDDDDDNNDDDDESGSHPWSLPNDQYDLKLRSLDLYGIKVPEPGIEPQWSGCRRVTCGTWTFLHIMTVGAGFSNTGQITPMQTMKLIQKIVDNFFGCEMCRLHFNAAYHSCGGGRCQWVGRADPVIYPVRGTPAVSTSRRGLLLWLWRFHNVVTTRTAAMKPEWAELNRALVWDTDHFESGS
eukprot:Polyplicarium_translucidae@DN2969_c0_g2_i4.p1